MKTVKILALAVMVLCIAACGNKNKATGVVEETCSCGGDCIMGSWTQPVPGMDSMTQGIKLDSCGVAESIGMATLVYKTWEKQGDTLILTGQSIGNDQTIDFIDTLIISRPAKDTLILSILSKGADVVWKLAKTGCCKDTDNKTGCCKEGKTKESCDGCKKGETKESCDGCKEGKTKEGCDGCKEGETKESCDGCKKEDCKK